MVRVAPPFRAAHAGLKPGATPQAVSGYFVDTTPGSRVTVKERVAAEVRGLTRMKRGGLSVLIRVSPWHDSVLVTRL